MKKHWTIILIFMMAVPVYLYSQTAQLIEELLNTDAVSNQQAAWLVLEAADISRQMGINSQIEAFRFAAEQQWLPMNAQAHGRARLDQISYLIMRSFNMRGGIFYSLFGGPHYAYRELVYRNLILGKTVPRMHVSGYDLLFIVNRVLSFQEANIL